MQTARRSERGSITLAVLAGLGLAGAGGGLLFALRRRRLKIVDLTNESPTDKRSKRSRPIDAVTLHATGFTRGNDPRKYTKVTTHFVITPDGTVVALHPPESKLPASNDFNDRSIAFEFVGNFRSARFKWNPDFPPDILTAAQIDAGRKLLRKLKAQYGIRHVFAHRQSHPERQNDPGPEIWAEVGQWAIRELGLTDGGDGFFIGEGRPIPEEWRISA